MGVKVCCSAREQGMPCSKGGVVQCSLTMKIMAVKAALVFVILLFLALSFVCEGLKTQSAGATDRAVPLLNREAKVAPLMRRNRIHTILLGSRSRFAGAIQGDNDGKEITKASLLDASKRQHLRKILARRLRDVSDGNCKAVAVATRFRSAHVHRRMGPTNIDPARQRIPLTSRPIKALFIHCANHGRRKVKKVGVRVALTSPSRAPPANQHVIPFGNNHRRALKQLPQLQVPPMPFTLPSVPQLSFTPPPSPQLQIPPLPFTLPQVPPLPLTLPPSAQLQLPPLQITLPQVPPLPLTLPAPPAPKPLSLSLPPLPPFPLINIPPLPIQIPPLPCVPTSAGKSLPPP